MIAWEYGIILWSIPVILLMALGKTFYDRKLSSKGSAVLSPDNFKKLNLEEISKQLKKEKLILLLAVIFFIIALAHPRIPGKTVEVEHRGSDLIIALDISQSMLVRDVAPNRLSKAIRFSTELIRALPGERYGLVFFAGSAFTQMPLSPDARVATLLLQQADPTQASNQGTAIGDAIELSIKMFDEEPGRGKILLIISDGEDHDPNTMEKLKAAVDKNIYIITVGVGTQQGGAVPDKFLGQETVMKDEDGQPVLSRFNAAFLQKMAEAARGTYFSINKSEVATKKIKEIVDRSEKGTLQTQAMVDYQSIFQWPLLLGLAFYTWWMLGIYQFKRK